MGSGASKGGSYKLTYFNGKGRAEVARLCLAAAGVKYEDIRVEQSDWPALKPKTPLGFLPVLEVNGKELTQKLVVDRYLAGQFGLFGSNDMEKAKIDEVMTTIADFTVDCTKPVFIKEEAAKAEAVKSIVDTKLPAIMAYLEKALDANQTNSGFIVGGKLSVADLTIFFFVDTLSNLSSTAIDKYTKLRDLSAKVGVINSIATYVANRKKTPF
ncbi:glutathione S-transferase 1-like [Mytilus edulis]|uniref:glutathione S-transferase 1-like n=1 Tax=Mytilus edulis TaxID=6550 RepID=UPI0039EFCC78